ncbi:MAG: transcriptional repressor LexA [Verrucomicrobiaceae bacterium]|nr:transcriptional repressor LexA [Verrucomicrobiaceae bacterium]
MRQSPTSKQQKLLDQVREWERLHGCVPTQTELAEACGYRSTNAVRSHLRLLEKKGLIQREPHKARAVRLTKGGRHASRTGKPARAGIPLMGTIAAGPLTEAVESADETLDVSPDLFGGDQLFALRVLGDSMKDAGVLSGDIAIIRRQEAVNDHQIAAVMVEGEATLKRVIKRGAEIVLHAANRHFKDIIVRADEGTSLRVLGILTGVIRREVV